MKLSLAEENAVLAALESSFSVNDDDFTPLYLCGQRLGCLNAQYAARLAEDLPHNLRRGNGALHLFADNWLQVGDLLQNAARGWYEAGLYDGWRSENFLVRGEDGSALFALERSAFRPLGLLSHAVHLNGFCRKNGRLYFWIGRRSPYKAVSPDKLDNLVGGGVSAGESIQAALIRESFEEAGLPENLIAPLPPRSVRLSLRTVARGLHREHLHIFDIELPENRIPQNQDGEIAAFLLMDAQEIAAAIAAGQFMNDAALALLDTFARMEITGPDRPLAQWLARFDVCAYPAAA